MQHEIASGVFVVVLGLSTAVMGGAVRAADDPATTPVCRQALADLQRAEDAAGRAAANPAPNSPVRLAQRRAALACLGAAALTAPPRKGQIQAPTSVPPVGALVRPLPNSAGATGVAGVDKPSSPRPAALSVTSCDANGCWASDGSRLTRQGDLLMGPRGTCTATGTVLNCP